MELIKEFRDVNFVYSLRSMDDITMQMLEKTEWPEKAKILYFQLNQTNGRDYETLWRNIGDRYFSRIFYYARKKEILVPDSGSNSGSLLRHSFHGKEEMAEIYVKTIAEYFWKPWERYIFGFYGKENSEKIIMEQALTLLESERVYAHEKNGEVVSFLAYKPIHEPVSGRDSEWVLWVWIKPELEVAERRQIRREFAEFLKGTGGNQWVVAATEPFNVSPNIFWQRMGLKLGCVNVAVKK